MDTLRPPLRTLFLFCTFWSSFIKTGRRVALFTLFMMVGGVFILDPAFSNDDKVKVTLLSSEYHLEENHSAASLLLTFQFSLPNNIYIHKPLSENPPGPIQLDFNDPVSFSSQDIKWPPSRPISINGISSEVYQGKFCLPISLKLGTSPLPPHFGGLIRFTYCAHNQCIPSQFPFRVNISEPHVPSFPISSRLSFWTLLTLLGGAFVGGIVLNFMPCVLPVLTMKITSLFKTGLPHTLTRNAYCFSSFFGHFLGILTFFGAFLGISTALQMGGAFLGWGAHFQNVYALGFLIFILLLCFLNSWGLVNLKVPTFLTHLIAKYIQNSVSSGFTHNSRVLNNRKIFWTHCTSGLFMSILATPCTAPFLGAAIGASLFLPFFIKLSIFFMVALGFSLPFGLLLLTHGTLFSWIRPGPWMDILKKTLSLGFLGTAVWLGWVLSTHVYPKNTAPSIQDMGNMAIAWHPLDLETLDHLAGQKQCVLVNVTASWCVTCFANELTTFKDKMVVRDLESHNVYKMKGDWSQPSPTITTYLRRFKRIGIPLTVVYGPSCPEGEVLSELLSPSGLLSAVSKCAQNPI